MTTKGGQPGADIRRPEISGRIDFQALLPLLPDLLDSLADAVMVVDRSRRIVAANRRYLEVFGRDRPVTGVPCRESVDCPETRDGQDACVACEVMRDRKPRRKLRSITDRHGVPRRWEATFSPILDGAGEVSHIVEVWRDVSDRTQLEAQISHSERLASLGILAAGVGHEINNPLASVMAGIESLERWLARRDFQEFQLHEAAEVLDVLVREVTRCRAITDKLMLLAQPQTAAPGWVSLNRVIEDTLSLLSHHARQHAVAISHALDPHVPQIWARDSAMRSVFMNLLMNGIQAMTEGGRLHVVTTARGDRVGILVEDSGPGIPAHLLPRIWDPFFTTKPVGQGTGLGLTITHRIVTRHGGDIRVESAPGAGARFLLELPVHGSGGSDV